MVPKKVLEFLVISCSLVTFWLKSAFAFTGTKWLISADIYGIYGTKPEPSHGSDVYSIHIPSKRDFKKTRVLLRLRVESRDILTPNKRSLR
jgi:hypothetical protein